MNPKIEELRAKKEKNEQELVASQHNLDRLQNRLHYYEKGERQQRAHRLITRGAAVESLVPGVKPMSEAAFYRLMARVFSLPEVKAILPVLPPDEGVE